MTTLERVVADVARARRELAQLPGHRRDAILLEMADALERRGDEILRENRLDVEAAKRSRSAPALIDRLLLDEDRVADMARAVRDVAALPDPIGTIDMGRTLPNGLELVRRRVPLGVVAVVYEGRPNVTVDAVSLCVKSGNAVVLRGSRLASRSNLILAEVLTGALIEAEAPRWAVALLGPDREELRRLVQMTGAVDLVIPRGGEELKAFLMEHSRVPVIYAASGNNHVYVHADADLDMALKITVNAKVQRPGVCNAAETLLVHADVAAAFLPAVEAALGGVELRADARAGSFLHGATPATDEDFAEEFLALILAVKVVDSYEDAIAHVNHYGS
ncbi:MAG TPA: glutamate-5-semialdehyde dehydrogenase, partial [Miltoncostaeaceae bacterium]|nr:glutamate-5-semialdehyde dehydrogenase [Miltoncostaeaceae bacterium]